jgi:DNA-binding transcriptional LysR family regulator
MDTELRAKIVELIRQHPKLRLHIEVGDWKALQEQLEEEKIEFFVAYPADLADNPKFKVTPLPGRPASTFCRAGHPLLKRSAPVTPSDYLAYPWAAVQMADEFSAVFRQACGLEQQELLPFTLSCSDTSLLREAVLHSDALLFTWHDWVMADLEAGRLVDIGALLKPQLALGSRTIRCGVVQMAGRTCSPAAQCAMEKIVSAPNASR